MPNSYVQIVSYGYATAIGGGVKNFINVYYFRRTGTGNPLVKANIEAAFQTAIMSKVLAAVSVSYTQIQNTVRFIEDALDPPIGFAEVGVGAIAGDRAPDFVAVTLQLRTMVRGRFARGSKHYGPIAESDTLGDTLVAGAVTRFNAIGTALTTGFTDADANTWFPSVVSNKPPAQYKVNPVTLIANDVTSTLLNKSMGTMRRRKIRTVN